PQGTTNLYSQWGTNGSAVYYTGGNVGIGTTTPSEALTVSGNILATGSLTATQAYITALTLNTTTGVLVSDATGAITASSTVSAAYLDPAVILASEIDTLEKIEALASVSNILIAADIDTSAELASILTDETGTGSLVFSG